MKHSGAAYYFTKCSVYLEYGVAATLLLAIFARALLLAVGLMETLFLDIMALDLTAVLAEALALIIGVEFVKMLVRHTPEAALEVLLFAIARGIVISHYGAWETLAGVVSMGVIFAIRRFLLGREKES